MILFILKGFVRLEMAYELWFVLVIDHINKSDSDTASDKKKKSYSLIKIW